MTRFLCVDFDGTLSDEAVTSLIKDVSEYINTTDRLDLKIGIVTSRSIYDDFMTIGQFYHELSEVLENNNIKLDFICTRFCLHLINPTEYERLGISESIKKAHKIPVFGDVVSSYLDYRAAYTDDIMAIKEADLVTYDRYVFALKAKVEAEIQLELGLYSKHIKGKISRDSSPKIKQIETIIASYGVSVDDAEVLLLDDDPKHVHAVAFYPNDNWRSVHYQGVVNEMELKVLNFLDMTQPFESTNPNVNGPKEFYIEQVTAFNPSVPTNRPDGIYINCPASILAEFKKLIAGTQILGATYFNPYTNQDERIPNTVDELTSRHLQILARNELVNVDGVMLTGLYNELLTDDQVARLRCLVKATTVSGMVYATHEGGFKQKRYKLNKPTPNLLIDQSGLQWQGDFRNTGGLHFYPADLNHKHLPQGYSLWQNEMYQAMYGIDRKALPSDNGLMVRWEEVDGILDLNSVASAIAVEFSQALEACVTQGELDLEEHDRINFKFCRAGMGFFSSGLETDSIHMLRVARLEGIESVLQRIIALPETERAQRLGKIRRIVLSGSNEAPYSDEVLARIENLVRSLNIEWGGASDEDALKQEKGYINATTNCADPHAMPGNEGGPSSVDACISYNANINNHIATYNNQIQLRTSSEFVFDLKEDAVNVSTAQNSQSFFDLKNDPHQGRVVRIPPKMGFNK